MLLAALCLGGVLLASLLLLVFLPVTLELSAEGRADANGFWGAAFGMALGPLSMSGTVARGHPLTVHTYAFGRERTAATIEDDLDDAVEPSQSVPATGARQSLISRGVRSFRRHFDSVDSVVWLLSERRRLTLDLDLDLAYSFRDVALTGKVLGGIYALTPLLPAGIRVRQAPGWESQDQGLLRASGQARVFIGFLLWDLFCYMLRERGKQDSKRRVSERGSWPTAKSPKS